jgi:DNA-binding NtrC family response regulator
VPQKRQIVAPVEPVLRSRAMRDIDRVLRAVAPKEVTITLIGESGVGKEVLARRVHELSGRRRGPFVPINCAAIPEALFESELFGHERGAFTGANERTRGKVEAASGGTLFLDEIGEMPLPMQAKLLRFLENRRFMRVGGATKIEADVRLVFATLRPLDEEVRAGRFRADLYYRIQGITLSVPALRDRRADIAPLLSRSLLELSSRHGVPPPRLSRDARAVLLSYDWPGNVRELRNVVETLCLLRSGLRAEVADLPAPLRAIAETPQERAGRRVVEVDLGEDLATITRRVVEAALVLERGDKARAASRLGISLRTVQRYVAEGSVRAAPRTRAASRATKEGGPRRRVSGGRPAAPPEPRSGSISR